MTTDINFKNVPEIRFKDFENMWNISKLKDLGSTFSGLSGKNKNNFGHGNAKFITYMNVFSNPISKLNELDLVELDNKQNNVLKGDVLFTLSSETPQEVGMSSIWIYDIPNIYLNSFSFGFRPKNKLDYYYLAFMLRNKNIRKQMVLLAQGISRFNISKKKVMEIKVPIPSLPEQEKIGSLFFKLDTLIATSKQKTKKLKMLKRALLQKMFASEKQRFPEIRFKGYSGKWEKDKIGDITLTYSGGTPTSSNKKYYNGEIPFIRSAEINKSETELFLTNLGYKDSSAKKVVKGNILYALYGANSGNVSISKINGVINQAILAIIPQQMFNTFFLMVWLESQKERIINKFLQGGQGNLSGNIIKNLKIKYPNFQEQESIGNLLNKLDALITTSEQKSAKLEELKKALLQKMFI